LIVEKAAGMASAAIDSSSTVLVDEQQLVTLKFDGSIAEIGLNSGSLNLVNKEMLRALNRALGNVGDQPEVRCLIVHGGNARAFCAGSDIQEFKHLQHDASEHKILFEDMVLRRLALGGGLELALACDLRVCKKGVTLGLTESRLGGLAGNGSVRLTRLVGPARARELLYTGEPIGAEQALAWGLVNRVVEFGTALDGARKLAATIASRGPLSNRLAKKLVDAAQDVALDAGLSMSTVAQREIFDSDDLHEGVAAFFAKRSPEFTGR
jgi:enoyl-CoA hydratase/carnithine racemase